MNPEKPKNAVTTTSDSTAPAQKTKTIEADASPSPAEIPAKADDIVEETVIFSESQHARLLRIKHNSDIDQVIERLQLDAPPRALIIMIGGAANLDQTLNSRLLQLCSRGIARAAAEMEAVIVDGGTDVGVMSMTGQGVMDRGRKSPLIGVAPAGLVNWPGRNDPPKGDNISALEPNHSHFLLLESERWGDEAELLDEVIKKLHGAGNEVPVLTLLISGGEIARKRLLNSVRMGSPIIVFANSGQLADEIVSCYENPQQFIEDPEIAEIVEEGNIHIFRILSEQDERTRIDELVRQISRQLRGDNVLKQAWKQFGEYELNATRHQRNFFRIQMAIIILGVLGTLLALSQASMESVAGRMRQDQTVLSGKLEMIFNNLREDPDLSRQQIVNVVAKQLDGWRDESGNLVQYGFTEPLVKQALVNSDLIKSEPFRLRQGETHETTWFMDGIRAYQDNWVRPLDDFIVRLLDMLDILLRYVIMAVPIVITALLAAANHFNWGTKWILLRGSAELLKSEIFCYRAQADTYSSKSTLKTSREGRLANKLKHINSQLIQTEVNMSALKPYEGPVPPTYGTASHDNGMTQLSPEQYLTTRLEDQLQFYINKTNRLDSQLLRLQWMLYIVGGIGTLLAALGLELWIALTSSLIAAFGTYMQYKRMEETLVIHNQARIGLTNVQSWWIALSAAEQARQNNIDMLVSNTEGILKSEFSSWVQDMQEAMNALREEQQAREEYLREEANRPEPMVYWQNKVQTTVAPDGKAVEPLPAEPKQSPDGS